MPVGTPLEAALRRPPTSSADELAEHSPRSEQGDDFR
jgi:hypothetical protein